MGTRSGNMEGECTLIGMVHKDVMLPLISTCGIRRKHQNPWGQS